jgi:hypothetical protein
VNAIMDDKEAPYNQTNAARAMGVDVRTLRRWTAGKKVPYSKIGNVVRYPAEFVKQFRRGEHPNGNAQQSRG